MTAVATLLARHVTFQLDSVDRIFVAGYVPELQHEGGLVRFLIHRGYRIPSPAGLGHNHDRLVADLEAFVAEQDTPLVRFGKGESKEEVARPYLADAIEQGWEGVVLIGKAQERGGWVAGLQGPHLDPPLRGPSPLHLPTPGPVRRLLVLLPRGRRVGTGLHQALPLRPLRDVGLPQWPRVGQAPARQGGGRFRGPRQRAALG
jgi:hypothetical protein